MRPTADFSPPTTDLVLYAGDGAVINLEATDQQNQPLPLTGEVTSQIRQKRSDPDPIVTATVTVTDNTAQITLTAQDTALLGDFRGYWDCQWSPSGQEPFTLMQGNVRCHLDVTRAAPTP